MVASVLASSAVLLMLLCCVTAAPAQQFSSQKYRSKRLAEADLFTMLKNLPSVQFAPSKGKRQPEVDMLEMIKSVTDHSLNKKRSASGSDAVLQQETSRGAEPARPGPDNRTPRRLDPLDYNFIWTSENKITDVLQIGDLVELMLNQKVALP
ncbi:uncharacterized protein LOC118429542 [Branchiostoma floridae]|uniref:Uncharacterized protein LOC118429542 n=1 Tax=Branchiostoma floridae TaxID=7739 RepID=C3YJD1_BRAFL|nr:uncharacterized protein LOC118429542 [Branchiostoma floridae]|eukprot:XP_002603618.1 hypothetical protein BRAFLDRAFT_93162 [Branchiostoma floridae]